MLKRLLIVTTIQLLESASNLVEPIENAVGMATRLILSIDLPTRVHHINVRVSTLNHHISVRVY